MVKREKAKPVKNAKAHCRKLHAKGAVSVFLVMILVPCLLVSSIFVDTGRVLLAKNMTRSAADLALDSLLTNYDYDLKEWYGLAASCQTIEEFYEVSADYFLRSMQSKGLSDEEIYLVSDYYANATNDDTIYDLLNAKLLTKKDELIKKVDNANLSNPAMMKREIVEFMKYRAPIEITKTLIERLKADETFSGAKNADKDKNLVDKKKEYYEKDSELLEAAYNTYRAIRAYQTKNYTNDVLKADVDKINKYKEVYKYINKKTIADILYTDELEAYHKPDYNLNDYMNSGGIYAYNEKSDQIYSSKVGDGDSAEYYIDAVHYRILYQELNTAIDTFNNAVTNVENSANSNATTYPSGDVNQVRWAVKVFIPLKDKLSTVNQTAGDMMTKFAKLYGAYNALLSNRLKWKDNTELSNWKNDTNNLLSQVYQINNDSLRDGANTSKFAKIANNIEGVTQSEDFFKKINPDTNLVNVDGVNMSFSSAFSHISSEVSAIRKKLDDYAKLLDRAIDGGKIGGDKVKSLDKLKSLAKEYQTAYSNWKTTAKNTNTDMGKNDRNEISEINGLCEKITETAVAQLKSRLVNIRTQLRNTRDAIDKVQFKGTKIAEINSFDTFKSKVQSGVVDNQIPINNSEINTFADNQFSSKWSPSSGNPVPLLHMDETNYNLQIDPETKKVNTPELYIYFHEKFKNTDDEELKKEKEEKKNAENAANDTQKNAENQGRYHYKGLTKTVGREYSNSTPVELGTSVFNSMVELITSLTSDSGSLDSIRDNLYVTTYIMNMFGYATYQDEEMFRLIQKDDSEKSAKLSIPMFGSNSVPSEYKSEDMVNKWKSKEPTDTYNKTLTNKMIDTTNNAAYCAEVEYILYGKTGENGKTATEKNSNEENIKKAYTQIYALRYPLNLVSGFQHFWGLKTTTGQAIESIAQLIQESTMGIIPAPLTKIVIILLLAAAETAVDLNRLEAGFPVEIYKMDAEDWKLAISKGTKGFSGVMNAVKGEGITIEAGNKGLFYSDYLTLFVYFGLGDSKAAQQMYKRMGEVIQTNIKKQPGAPSTYSLKKSHVYFELNADVRVKPLMIALPHFAEYKNNLSKNTDWCTYHIRTVRGY